MSDPAPSTPTTHTNALIKEKSPYLLQHAHNPVDWMPWGPEAFKKAVAEDKPIFLSSGYSTCHWCHVMERESFENEEIAAYLNEHFVPVKVDREERPDVDLTYMTYVQAASGHGGWPMSVFLTPELKPFYGGTYYPAENQAGRIGFKNLLIELARVWKEDRPGVLERASTTITKLQDYLDSENKGQEATVDAVIQKAYDDLSGSYDYHEGGFSGAPKFPRPTSVELLFRIHLLWQGDKDKESEANWAAEMSVKTLRAMAQGGIRDHIGGGFHRYSVDGYWHVPHYEKMLYDQAQLLTAYVEGYQLSESPFLADISREIITYVSRDLGQADGGFFSAEDADSYAKEGDDHKREGAFYVWTAAEIDELLGKEEGSIFRYAHGARRDGNARPESDPHGELKGLNTLFRAFSVKKTAEYFKKEPAEVQAIFEKGYKTLFEARNKRPHPHLDDKVITAWNGLMISGLARAGAGLGDAAAIQRAEKAADFLHRNLCGNGPGKDLHRSWRDGQRGPRGFAMDYASLIHGLIDLYQASLEIRWLQWAVALQEEMDSRFLDRDNGGYYSVHTDMADSVLRIKEDYDGAEPSPNSLAALNLVRLAGMLDREDWRQQAAQIFHLFGQTLSGSPASVPMMVRAFDFHHHGKQQIVLAGDRTTDAFRALEKTIHSKLRPNLSLLHADSGAAQAWLGERNAALAAMKPVDGAPAAYVCQNYTCQAPVTTPEALSKLIDL
ncbi:MAG: thioredoxin domain-containing protein [Verrucomicrobiales bacterium]|nr:thioredoxin domain-containing protein [Verrucomicrobiales bacterium]MCP5559857.1 thioredoxin domain-containing protein [Verrucomicrobiaceae bacterium]